MSDPVYSCESLAALPIHASAVQANGGALLFLGPPETGKSTVRRMLEAHLPELADDVVYLVPRPGEGWGVAPAAPQAFLGPLPAAEAGRLSTVPLQAVLRLQRATQAHLERIPALQTCRYLADAFFEVYWPRYCDVPAKKLAFARLARIARAVAGYHLHFDLSARTVEVLMEALFPQG